MNAFKISRFGFFLNANASTNIINNEKKKKKKILSNTPEFTRKI
jgi:hypothetical protein